MWRIVFCSYEDSNEEYIPHMMHSCECRGEGTNGAWYNEDGDTPTGVVMGHTIELGYPEESYGPYKRIALDELVSGDFKEAYEQYGRSGIQIHGGRDQSHLWNTHGCVRIFDKDIKKITDHIYKYCKEIGKITINEQ